jgi:hypothetical protein
MRKLFSVLAISVFALSFSQQNNTNIKVTVDKSLSDKIYKGGQDKFKENLSDNLQYTANDFQVLGDYQLNFSVDENGKISDVKLYPELFDKSLEREMKRDLSRIGKHFVTDKKQNISVGLSFSREVWPQDSRGSFAQGR